LVFYLLMMKLKIIVLIIFCLLIAGVSVYKKSGSQKSLAEAFVSFISPHFSEINSSPEGLKKAIEKEIKGANGKYGIVVKNLKTGESCFANEHMEFEAASLYKLWVMATVFNQIQEGKLSKNEVLSREVEELNRDFNIDSEVAELTEGTITLSVEDALAKMITISDNYAALLLAKRIGLSIVQTFLKDNLLEESIIGEPPITTAYDVALFFEKLYNGELANQENTKLMLNLLKGQLLNHKLPKYLSEEVTVAHKTGELGIFSHDAGIVYGEKGDYIIAVLSESDDRLAAEEQIAKISKSVYEYFEENR